MPRKSSCCQILLAVFEVFEDWFSSLPPPAPVPTWYGSTATKAPLVHPTSPPTSFPPPHNFPPLMQQHAATPAPAKRRPLMSAPPPMLLSPQPSTARTPTQSQRIKKRPKSSRSLKAGLEFPVGRIDRFMKQREFADRIGASAPVFIAAVLEYLAAEILESAGDCAKGEGKKKITPRHIHLAKMRDEELDRLLGRVVFAFGEV